MIPQLETIREGSQALADLLSQAVDCLETIGSDFGTTRSRLGELRERLEQGRFHLAVLGQFKRGKSTLLNALLGEKVLPTSVVPLTAIPTFIRQGQTLQGTAFFQDHREPQVSAPGSATDIMAFLSRFVTEEGNPKNQLGVSHVEVTHPAAILNNGVVLIDTPGIGSTFQHNTEMTLNFLPQCDAALFLVSADPPITEVEVGFLKEARKKISRLFFILNKADYLSSEERKVAVDFLRTVLVEQAEIEAEVPILCISAKQGLVARGDDDSDAWKQSGLAEVEHQLIQFLAHEKAESLCEAVKRKAGDLLAQVMMRLQLAIRSLQMPLQDLQQRLEIFEQKIEEVKEQREIATDLMAGDKKRMFAYLEAQAEQLRSEAREYLEKILEDSFTSTTVEDLTEEGVQAVLDKVIPGYFEHQSGVVTEQVGKRMTKVLSSHEERAVQLIESVRKTAADLFEITYHAPEAEKAFQIVRKPYWVTHRWSSMLSPIPKGAIEKLLPSQLRKQRIQKRVKEQIDTLACHNVENLRWTIYQSINETFWRFGSTLDERLADTLAATHGAIRVAMEKRQKHSEVVTKEVSRLETAIHELQGLQEKLQA